MEVYLRIAKPSCSPLRYGQRPSASAMWAVCGTSLLMDRAVTCGGWPRFRVPQVSAASVPERLMSGVPGTHVPMVDTAGKAGTATFVTVTVPAT